MVKCVCSLMPSCNTYRLTWVSLTLGVGYLFMAAPEKRSHCSLPWTEGYLLTTALPDLQYGIAPLGPPAPAQPGLLGRGVGPPSHHPWPLPCGCSSPSPPLASGLGAWGISSGPPPLASGLGHGHLLPATAPDLGRGVAPLCCSCAVAVWYSRLLPLTLDVGWLLSAMRLRYGTPVISVSIHLSVDN